MIIITLSTYITVCINTLSGKMNLNICISGTIILGFIFLSCISINAAGQNIVGINYTFKGNVLRYQEVNWSGGKYYYCVAARVRVILEWSPLPIGHILLTRLYRFGDEFAVPFNNTKFTPARFGLYSIDARGVF